MVPSESGPPPGAASKAASRREPIILQGFDRRRQFDIQFKTIPFGAIWLRRTYTNEQHKHITQRTKSDEIRLQEVRYGNNITVLLKACFQLRRFYGSHEFWSAIAKGFGASADVVRDMVELLVDARNKYRRDNPDEVDITRSGASIAADRWDSFLANQGYDMGTAWRIESPPASSGSQLHGHASAFFTETRGKQVDLANVLPKEVDYQQYRPSYSRKRLASPEVSDQPPSPKRRASMNYLERNESLPAHSSQPLIPLSTGNHTKASATQDYQSSNGVSQQPAPAKSPAQASPDEGPGIFRIRGTAAKTKSEFLSIERNDLILNHALSNDSSDGEIRRMQQRIHVLERELFDMKSQLMNDQHIRTMVDRILSEKSWKSGDGLLATLNPAVSSMQTRIASLEGNVAEWAARHEQDLEHVKESIRVAKDELVSSKDSLVMERDSMSSHDEVANSTLHALKSVQDRLAFLEDKLIIDGTTERQTKDASLEPSAATIQSQTEESSVPAVQEVVNRLARLEDKVMLTGTLKDNAPKGGREMRGNIQSLENGVSSLANRVIRLETESAEGEHVREVKSRVEVIEHQLARIEKETATKNLVENTFKQMDSHLTYEKDAAAEQMEAVHQRLAIMETENSRVTGIVDALKSLPPSPDTQQKIEMMLKMITSLPTEAAVTDMIFKREQISKSENEKLRRIVDHVSTKIKSLPNTAFVPERIFRLEQSLRDELERHQKDIRGLVAANRKDLETLQVQFKGLNKLWNEVTTGMAKSNDLLTFKAELDALRGNVAIHAKRLDIFEHGLTKSSDETIAKLERRIEDLSTQVRTALPGVTVADVSKRPQEVSSLIHAVPSTVGDARVSALSVQIDVLFDRTSTLATALNEMGQVMQSA